MFKKTNKVFVVLGMLLNLLTATYWIRDLSLNPLVCLGFHNLPKPPTAPITSLNTFDRAQDVIDAVNNRLKIREVAVKAYGVEKLALAFAVDEKDGYFKYNFLQAQIIRTEICLRSRPGDGWQNSAFRDSKLFKCTLDEYNQWFLEIAEAVMRTPRHFNKVYEPNRGGWGAWVAAVDPTRSSLMTRDISLRDRIVLECISDYSLANGDIAMYLAAEILKMPTERSSFSAVNAEQIQGLLTFLNLSHLEPKIKSLEDFHEAIKYIKKDQRLTFAAMF